MSAFLCAAGERAFDQVLGARRGPEARCVRARAQHLQMLLGMLRAVAPAPATRAAVVAALAQDALSYQRYGASVLLSVFGMRARSELVVVRRQRRRSHLWPSGPAHAHDFHNELWGGVAVDFGHTLCGQPIAGTLEYPKPSGAWRRASVGHFSESPCARCARHPAAAALLADPGLPLDDQRRKLLTELTLTVLTATFDDALAAPDDALPGLPALRVLAAQAAGQALISAASAQLSADGALALWNLSRSDFGAESCRAAGELWGDDYDRARLKALRAGQLLSGEQWQALIEPYLRVGADGELELAGSRWNVYERLTNCLLRQAGQALRERAAQLGH